MQSRSKRTTCDETSMFPWPNHRTGRTVNQCETNSCLFYTHFIALVICRLNFALFLFLHHHLQSLNIICMRVLCPGLSTQNQSLTSLRTLTLIHLIDHLPILDLGNTRL